MLDANSREPLPGATVSLSNAVGRVAPSTAITDENGRVGFPVLPTGGGYTIEVSMPGFGAQRLNDLKVQTGRLSPLTVLLSRPLEEVVRVTSRSAVVELEQVGASNKFSDEFIEGLPQSGRRYQDVLPIAPGVVDADGDGNPNVLGGRTRDFRTEVGGISNVDPLTGLFLSQINADSIEEMDIKTFGAGVEFGRAQAGHNSIIQKQGTNDIEGVFGFLYRSSDLDGDGAGLTTNLPQPDFESLQPSFQLSGPLVRDRLWFRMSYEYIDREDPVNLLGELAVSELKQSIFDGQLTWQVTPKHKLAFQFRNDPLEQTNLDVSSSLGPDSTYNVERGGNTSAVDWTGPISPRLLLTGLVSFQDHDVDIVPSNANALQNCIEWTGLPSLAGARCTDLANNTTTGPWTDTSLDNRQRLTVRHQTTYYGRYRGQSHQLKLGVSIEDESYDRDLTRIPSFDFCIEDDTEACDERQRPINIFGNPMGITSLEVPVPRRSRAKAEGINYALWLEDQWKPQENLTVTLGLRVDREEMDADGFLPIDAPAESANFLALLDQGVQVDDAAQQSFTIFEDYDGLEQDLAEALNVTTSQISRSFVDFALEGYEKTRTRAPVRVNNTNLSPRLNVSWDPWRTGKTKLSVSAGRYYDSIFLAIPLAEQEPVNAQNQIDAEWAGVGRPFRISSNRFGILPLTARIVDRDLKTPYQDEFAFGFERELWIETSLKLSYIRRRFRDQLQDVDSNHQTGDFGSCGANMFQPFGGSEVVTEGRLILSPGSGQTVFDPWVGEEYIDTVEGIGDGRLDDCLGDVERAGTNLFPTIYEIPDSKADLYVQNPAWEELLVIGNFNEADYEGYILELIRRQYRSWELMFSYTYSEIEGNAEDFDLLLSNENNLVEDETGFLDYDQRHVVKLNSTFLTPFGMRVGLGVQWQSGQPYSLIVDDTVGFGTPPVYPFGTGTSERSRVRYPTGQRNDQRNVDYWNVDLLLAKELRVGDTTVQLSAEVFNVLNDSTLLIERQKVDSGDGGRGTAITATRRFGRRYQVGCRIQF